MQIHELKCDPGPFEDFRTGLKRYEVRKDDRGFAVGDLLLLRKTQLVLHPASDPTVEPTHEVEFGLVRHYLSGGQYGIEEGYCVLGVDRVTLAVSPPSMHDQEENNDG